MQERIEEATAQLALGRHDPLTGLVNRRGSRPAWKGHCRRPGHGGGESSLSSTSTSTASSRSSTCGHLAGDGLLRQLSPPAPGPAARRDTLARLGGTSSGVLPQQLHRQPRIQVAQDFLQSGGGPSLHLAGQDIFHWRQHRPDPHRLADLQRGRGAVGQRLGLLRCQEQGRNRVQVVDATPPSIAASPTSPGGTALPAALSQDRLVFEAYPLRQLNGQGRSEHFVEIPRPPRRPPEQQRSPWRFSSTPPSAYQPGAGHRYAWPKWRWPPWLGRRPHRRMRCLLPLSTGSVREAGTMATIVRLLDARAFPATPSACKSPGIQPSSSAPRQRPSAPPPATPAAASCS